MRTIVVRCFRCREEGHKCKECPSWIKRKSEERAARVARPQKAQQEKELACPEKGKAQEKERRLRKVEEKEVACMVKPRKAQQGKWKRSSWEDLRKRAEWYCGPTVP